MSNPLDTRFTTPALAPHVLSPPRIPCTPQSTEVLKKVLKDNHQRWHIFFNDMGFHNHSAHRMLALWALGASGEVIEDGYVRDSSYQRPVIQPPQSISEDNFDDHLGDQKYYQAYIDFFSQEIEEGGMAKAVENWVFSSRANLGGGDNLPEDKQPRMLARFIAGLVHPLIHTGYGAEFGLPGMLAEGLAQVAVHSAEPGALVPLALFDGTLSSKKGGEDLRSKSPTALELLGEVYDELHLESKKQSADRDYDRNIGRHASAIHKIVEKWELDVEKLGQDSYLQSKIKELAFLVVSIYGATGVKETGFIADFFFMHLVTSSIFLASLCALLSPVARYLLLRTYITTAYAVYTFRPCKPLDFSKLYSREDTAAEGSGKANPWLPIVEYAIEHHDEHLSKTHRALFAWASHFGSEPPTTSVASTSPGLLGLEKLDGTIFVKVAQLTTSRVGPRIENHRLVGRPVEWDFEGLVPAGPPPN